MTNAFNEYLCCPVELASVEATTESLTGIPDFFTFGEGVLCYGQYRQSTWHELSNTLPDVLKSARVDGHRLVLPFDLTQVVANFRHERYPRTTGVDLRAQESAVRRLYYAFRPILPVAVRKHLQRIRLSGWQRIAFPKWPVDFTVEHLMEQVLSLILRSVSIEQFPFIWFWPDGIQSGAVMTHDVEASAGLDFVPDLMTLDESFGVRSAFQVVPEVRYDATRAFIDKIRKRGFEVNVHDLNHDGSLYLEKKEFLRRATKINQYAKDFGTEGFRAGAMYRNQDWYDAFDIAYDMSVPNVAHLEPQRGGCCTVMPYFIGKILELPLTTIQDYSLFHILDDYSIDLWKLQTELIMERNGLISFIIHPDYMIDKRARQVYTQLLRYITDLRDQRKIWMALPGEVNRWWRNRSQMKLVPDGSGWKIVGPDSERARVAYATLEGDRVKYEVKNHS